MFAGETALAERLLEAGEIGRIDVDESAAGAIYVRDEEEGDRNNDGKDEEHTRACAGVAGAVADEQIAAAGDRDQEPPRGSRDAVAPSGEGIAAGVEDAVHSGDGEDGEGSGRGLGARKDEIGHAILELVGVRADLLKALFIALAIKGDTKVDVVAEHGADFSGSGRGEQSGARVLGADGVGFGLLKVFALVVAADGHGEAEADDESEQSEGGGLHDVEVFALGLEHGAAAIGVDADELGEPEHEEGSKEEKTRVIEHRSR
jgi:hypothetical protein